MQTSFGEVVGALLSAVALGVLAYIAVQTKDPLIIGVLAGVVAAGNGFFLRAKVQATSHPPPTATVNTPGPFVPRLVPHQNTPAVPAFEAVAPPPPAGS